MKKSSVLKLGLARVLVVTIVLSSVMVNNKPAILYAAGKTEEAFKTTSYSTEDGMSGKSDAKIMYKGIINYDSKYSGTYKEGNDVSNSNFYSKSKTIKYWASHGNNSGCLWGTGECKVGIDIFNDKSTFSWKGSNLEFVFLAACNQLNKEGKNPVKKYAKAMIGDKAVRVICGYHSYAPGYADYMVANQFLKYAKTGESVKSSWIKANEYVYNVKGYTNAKNYAVLTHSGNVQYSRFPGFSSTTYPRPDSSSKKIIRFRRGVESGENIISSMSLKKKSINNKIQFCKLKAKSVKVNVKKKCKDMVFHDGYTISTDVGEIVSNKIVMSRDELYKESTSYFTKNLNFDENVIKLNEDDMIVAPIVSSDACTDEEETTVAYSVQFENTYKGIPIQGDGYNVIIDAKGVKYTSVTWHEYEEEDIETEPIDVNEAANVVFKGLKKEYDGIKALSNSAYIEKNIKKVSVVYSYNDETGYYEPIYQFTLNDNTIKEVNCIDGTLIEEE